LQRFVGYALTGDISEEMLTYFYGVGGTGKGTFISSTVGILDDYAVSVPVEVFTAGSHLQLEYYRAKMAGARLVTASETEAGTVWAESQIKELTGNEAPLPARQPYGKPFSFIPTFKLLLVGNNAPRLRGRSSAMERRLRVVPFKIKPQVADPELKNRLRTEWPAILRWMIDGCLTWQRERLGSCAAVASETGIYFEQQDAFGRWLEERCIMGNTLSAKPSALLTDFLAWVRENGELTVGSAEFREMVERTQGLRYAKNGGTQWVRGIGLKPPAGYHDRQITPD
jgi:putative DNA primase/helicase